MALRQRFSDILLIGITGELNKTWEKLPMAGAIAWVLCPPKACVLKAWPSAFDTIGRWWDLLDLGPSKSLRACPWRGYWDPGPPSPSHLFPDCLEVSRPLLAHIPTMLYCTIMDPKQQGQLTMDSYCMNISACDAKQPKANEQIEELNLQVELFFRKNGPKILWHFTFPK